MRPETIFAIFLYIVILVSIGLIASKKNDSSANYILGSRSLNYWITAISANASDMSIWLFMGLPMAIYDFGFLQAWSAIGLIFFMFLNWQLVAKRLRQQTEKLNSITIFDFFEKKTGTSKYHYLSITASFISVLFLTIYISAGIMGMGYLFEVLFGLNYYLGCAVSVIAILAYVSLGGFTAICYADFAQGIFLMIVIVMIPLIVFYDGFIAGSLTQSMTDLDSSSFIPKNFSEIGIVLSLAFGWGIGYFGQPHILNKFMAIKDPMEIQKAKWVGTIWQILALSGAVFSAVAAKIFFSSEISNSELIFVLMVNKLFPAFIAAFILCAILAATLSTADSQILVVASVIAKDFYAAIDKKVTDKKTLFVSRLSAITVCLIALLIALFKSSTIHSLVYYCWAGLGCSFGPLMLVCLYKKRINKASAFMGMLTGCFVALTWPLINDEILSLIPGFIAGLLAIFITEKIVKSDI